MLLFKDFLKACIANSVKAQPKRFPHQFQQWKTICILAKPRTIEFSVQKVSIPPTIPVSHPNTDVCFSLQGNERTEAVCFSCVKHKPKSAAHLRVLKAFPPQKKHFPLKYSVFLLYIQPQIRGQLKYNFLLSVQLTFLPWSLKSG